MKRWKRPFARPAARSRGDSRRYAVAEFVRIPAFCITGPTSHEAGYRLDSYPPNFSKIAITINSRARQSEAVMILRRRRRC